MSRHTVDDLQAIADAIVAMAEPGEQIEANVARSRETDIRVYNGDLEHFVSAQSQGISVRVINCLLYTSPSPRDRQKSRMPSSA